MGKERSEGRERGTEGTEGREGRERGKRGEREGRASAWHRGIVASWCHGVVVIPSFPRVAAVRPPQECAGRCCRARYRGVGMGPVKRSAEEGQRRGRRKEEGGKFTIREPLKRGLCHRPLPPGHTTYYH